MPTSNGQVTARDIRQKAVKSLHIFDANVTTSKIADLAVTLEKNAEVIDWEVGENQAQNVTINTTFTAHASVDIDIPAWATVTAVSTASKLQATITSDTTFVYWTTIDSPGEPGGAWNEELAMTGIRHLDHTRYWEATVTPGSTVTVEFWIRTSSGSNTSNIVRLDTLALFRR